MRTFRFWTVIFFGVFALLFFQNCGKGFESPEQSSKSSKNSPDSSSDQSRSGDEAELVLPGTPPPVNPPNTPPPVVDPQPPQDPPTRVCTEGETREVPIANGKNIETCVANKFVDLEPFQADCNYRYPGYVNDGQGGCMENKALFDITQKNQMRVEWFPLEAIVGGSGDALEGRVGQTITFKLKFRMVKGVDKSYMFKIDFRQPYADPGVEDPNKPGWGLPGVDWWTGPRMKHQSYGFAWERFPSKPLQNLKAGDIYEETIQLKIPESFNHGKIRPVKLGRHYAVIDFFETYDYESPAGSGVYKRYYGNPRACQNADRDRSGGHGCHSTESYSAFDEIFTGAAGWTQAHIFYNDDSLDPYKYGMSLKKDGSIGRPEYARVLGHLTVKAP